MMMIVIVIPIEEKDVDPNHLTQVLVSAFHRVWLRPSIVCGFGLPWDEQHWG